jgi:hypothetical protein
MDQKKKKKKKEPPQSGGVGCNTSFYSLRWLFPAAELAEN